MGARLGWVSQPIERGWRHEHRQDRDLVPGGIDRQERLMAVCSIRQKCGSGRRIHAPPMTLLYRLYFHLWKISMDRKILAEEDPFCSTDITTLTTRGWWPRRRGGWFVTPDS